MALFSISNKRGLCKAGLLTFSNRQRDEHLYDMDRDPTTKTMVVKNDSAMCSFCDPSSVRSKERK